MRVKFFYYIVTSVLYGILSFIDIKLAVFVFIILMCVALIFEKYKNYIVVFLFLSMFLIPLWVNSYGLFRVSFGIIKINYPLIGLMLVSIAVISKGA